MLRVRCNFVYEMFGVKFGILAYVLEVVVMIVVVVVVKDILLLYRFLICGFKR